MTEGASRAFHASVARIELARPNMGEKHSFERADRTSALDHKRSRKAQHNGWGWLACQDG